MKILFLTLYPEVVASSRYRVYQFLPGLKEYGFECTVKTTLTTQQYLLYKRGSSRISIIGYHFKEFTRRVFQILEVGKYDLVFVQKALISIYLKGFVELLKRRVSGMVYDIDDAVHLKSPNPLPHLLERWHDPEQPLKLFRLADCVLAGNNWLKSEVEKYGGKAILFPTVVDTDRFCPRSRDDGEFVVGWIGSPSTTRALTVIGTDLSKLNNASVILVGADKTQISWENAKIIPWALHDEVMWIQRFSVGLMPSYKDDWSRGKCGLKALLYMACGVPCIATPFGSALEIIRHGETGFFADSPKEWVDYIELLRDPVLRRTMGDAARAEIEARFSLKKAVKEMASCFHMMM